MARSSRNAVNDINCQIETVNLVKNRQFQRSIDVSLLFIATHVNVVVVPPAVGELMDQAMHMSES